MSSVAGTAPPGIDMAAVPRPWSYNPSQWSQRVRVCLVAGIAVLISTYMGLFQLGLIDSVWDPVFGAQSQKVLTSNVSHTLSRWFLMPDALFGALAYLGDIIFGLAGSTRRWQYRPWIVILFGLDVIPLGFVSAILVVLQGTIVGSWCFLCLVTAVISLALVVLAHDEVWSSVCFLHGIWKRSGDWKVVCGAFCGRPSDIAHEVAQQMVVDSDVGKEH